MKIVERQVGDVTILDLHGKILIGEGDDALRDAVTRLVDGGKTKILLNLADVPYVDSAGLGEIVRCYTTVSRKGGRLKLREPDQEDPGPAGHHQAPHRLRDLRLRRRGRPELLDSLHAANRPPRRTSPRRTPESAAGLGTAQPACGGVLVSLRPHQWTKNLVVFAALGLSKHLFEAGPLLRSLLAFALFCGLSGAVYLLNDVADLERDRLHPAEARCGRWPAACCPCALAALVAVVLGLACLAALARSWAAASWPAPPPTWS